MKNGLSNEDALSVSSSSDSSVEVIPNMNQQAEGRRVITVVGDKPSQDSKLGIT